MIYVIVYRKGREAKMNPNKLSPKDVYSLAKIIGLNEALVLQQLNYWLNKPGVGVERDGYKWVYNTYEQWHKNFPFWSIITIKRIFYRLEDAGLIISVQLDKSHWDQTKYYRINYQALEELVGTLTVIEDDNKPLNDLIEGIEMSTMNVSPVEMINLTSSSISPAEVINTIS